MVVLSKSARESLDGIDTFLLKLNNRRVWDAHLIWRFKEHTRLTSSQRHLTFLLLP
jgi:hypothetical protein